MSLAIATGPGFFAAAPLQESLATPIPAQAAEPGEQLGSECMGAVLGAALNPSNHPRLVALSTGSQLTAAPGSL